MERILKYSTGNSARNRRFLTLALALSYPPLDWAYPPCLFRQGNYSFYRERPTTPSPLRTLRPCLLVIFMPSCSGSQLCQMDLLLPVMLRRQGSPPPQLSTGPPAKPRSVGNTQCLQKEAHTLTEDECFPKACKPPLVCVTSPLEANKIVPNSLYRQKYR